MPRAPEQFPRIGNPDIKFTKDLQIISFPRRKILTKLKNNIRTTEKSVYDYFLDYILITSKIQKVQNTLFTRFLDFS